MDGDRSFANRAATGRVGERCVALLMAVRNGEAYLDAQIATLARQRCSRIDLWISDDGSTDATLAIAARTAEEWSLGRVTLLAGPEKGFAENYRALLTNPEIDADYVAFCDQDDVWEDDKLSTAIEWLDAQPPGRPALYCSRTRIISADGEPIGESPLFARRPSFRNALVQSIAGGNTMVMNRAAHQAVREAASRTSFVSHDWWCYLIVTGIGGIVHYSPDSKIGYRQHGGNLVGENNSWRARMFRLRHLFRGRLKRWNEANLQGLEACSDMLTADATLTIGTFERARDGNLFERFAALRRSGVYRQTFLGQAGLHLACLFRKI